MRVSSWSFAASKVSSIISVGGQRREAHRALIVVLLFSLIMSATPSMAAGLGEKCASDLAKALAKTPSAKAVQEVAKVAERCSGDAPTQVAAGDLYLKLQKDAGADWLKRALGYYGRGVGADSTSLAARWGLASVLGAWRWRWGRPRWGVTSGTCRQRWGC
jgi:hypothetical protein